MDTLRALLPSPLMSAYHWCLAWIGAILYGFPSRRLCVIAVTGTKGKSSTVELVAALLRASGKKVAVASTIHFVIGAKEERNLFKMTMPGRFFLQRFLREALSAGSTHAVIEVTSEGTLQHRHRGIALDALVFTNLSPEHLERHGGLEQYGQAKLSYARALERSRKRPRIMVANADDAWGQRFLKTRVEKVVSFSLSEAEPYQVDDRSVRFLWRGGLFLVPLPGLFSLKNCLAALTLGEALGLPQADMKKALEHMGPIAGRAERVERGQPFDAVVDYAHTPDSLRALFEAFAGKRIICVIGSTGGGRDTWNRPEKGKIADELCDVSIIANEDPYDENPKEILSDIAKGFSRHKPTLILDRRVAISSALKEAKEGDAVLITGKGTDPYIMGAQGARQPWSDVQIVAEELAKLGYTTK